MKKRALILALCLVLALGCMLIFTSCNDECAHQWGEWQQTKAPTCEAEGENTRTCTLCPSTNIQKIPAVDHNYVAGEWHWDEGLNEAYLSFTCSYNSAHTVNYTGTISTQPITAPTCNEAGEETVIATLEFKGTTYTDTKTRVTPATKNHSYGEDGNCSICGSACPHSNTTAKNLNLHDQGFCVSYIDYDLCNDCGKVIFNTESFATLCNPEEIIEIDETTTSFVCGTCGLKFTTVDDEGEGCVSECKFSIKVEKDNVVYFESSITQTLEGHSSDGEIYLDLREYSDCYNYFVVSKCYHCDKIISIEDYKIFCDNGATSTPSITEINGVEHKITTIDCDNCSLKFIIDEWTETLGCESTELRNIKIYEENDTLICDVTDALSSTSTHEPVFEGIFANEDDTCMDPHISISYCKICGIKFSQTSEGYHDNIESFEYDFSSYPNYCGGGLAYEKCTVCNTVTDIEISDFNNHTLTNTQEESSTSFHSVVTCTTCGFKYDYLNQDIEDGCSIDISQHKTIFMGTEKLLESAEYLSYKNHDFDYKYELITPNTSCEDGVLKTSTCSICNHSYSDEINYHVPSIHSEYDLSELDSSANGKINIISCVCGDVFNVNLDYVDTSSILYSDYYEEIDGVNHYFKTYKSQNEKFQLIFDYYDVISGCFVSSNVNTIFIYGDSVRLECSYVENEYENHNYEFKKVNLVGDNCENGLYIAYVCKNCDELSFQLKQSHELFNAFVLDAEELGICDYHVLNLDVCACTSEYLISSDLHNLFKEEDENSITYTCSCGYKVVQSVETTVDGCIESKVETISVYVNDELIYEGTSTNKKDVHTLTTSLTPVLDTNLFSFIIECSKCDLEQKSELLIADITNHNGEYYYDLIIEPSENESYFICSVADSDTYVTLYRIEGEEYIRLGKNDDSGLNSNFLIHHDFEAGNKYALRIGFYSYNQSGEIPVVISKKLQLDCSHSTDTQSVYYIPEDTEQCTDGYYCLKYCNSCFNITSFNFSDDHLSNLKASLEINDNSYCETSFNCYECMCGLSYVTDSSSHYYEEIDSNTYVEDEIEHYYTKYDCIYCNLIKEQTIYYKIEGCIKYKYTTYKFTNTDGDVLLDSVTEKSKYNENHTLTTEYDFKGTTCEDGVTVTKKCSLCDYSNEEYFDYCYNSSIYSYYHNEGDCYHYIDIYGCPCGNNLYIEYDDSSYDENGDCPNCDFSIIIEETSSKDENCIVSSNKIVTVKNGEDILFTKSFTLIPVLCHSYSATISKVNDNYIATMTCSECENVLVQNIYYTDLVDYSYSFNFTPDKTGIYSIYSVSNNDTRVYLNDNENDDGGYETNFLLTSELTEGTNYEYSMEYLSQSNDNFYFVFTEGELIKDHCNYNSEYDSVSTEDESLTIVYCKECGTITEISVE